MRNTLDQLAKLYTRRGNIIPDYFARSLDISNIPLEIINVRFKTTYPEFHSACAPIAIAAMSASPALFNVRSIFPRSRYYFILGHCLALPGLSLSELFY